MSLRRESPQGVWKSRWTFVAAATGLAVGLGNFWRFPHEVGEYGGLPYILLYVIFVLMIAMPVMMAEVVMGSRGRANPETTIEYLSAEHGSHRAWRIFPMLGMLTGGFMLIYLSIVAGWVSHYAYILGRNRLEAISIEYAGDYFGGYLGSSVEMAKGLTGFLLILAVLSLLRVTWFTGQLLRLLLPLMLIMFLVALYSAATMGDILAASDWMFAVRMDDFGFDAVKSALGQAFYTLGIGVGAMMIYGAYFPDGRSITRQVGFVVMLDTLVSILAGLCIYAFVLNKNLEPGNSVALLFISLPHVFGNMPFGDLVGSLFYSLLALVMLCSAIALLEPVVSWISERTPLHHWVAVVGVCGVVWASGLYIINQLSFADASLFNLLNTVAANYLLPVSALGLAVYGGWILTETQARDELYYSTSWNFWIWRKLLRYIAPPAIITVLVFNILGA